MTGNETKDSDGLGGAVRLDVEPGNVIAVGGPHLHEVEALVPVIKHIRDTGGSKYHALLIIYKDDVDVGPVHEFRDTMIARMHELGGNVSRETILDMRLVGRGTVIGIDSGKEGGDQSVVLTDEDLAFVNSRPVESLDKDHIGRVLDTKTGQEMCGACLQYSRADRVESTTILCEDCHELALKHGLIGMGSKATTLKKLYVDLREAADIIIETRV